MILYFSGTGNSAYAAKRVAEAVGDEVLDLFPKLRARDHSPLESRRPWLVVSPVYAWRLPHLLQDWLEQTPLTGSKELYFLLTCGSSMGNAGKYLEALCRKKGLSYRGCFAVQMPENYIALFRTPSREAALEIIHRAEPSIQDAAALLARGEPFPQQKPSLLARFCSGPVNRVFYPLFVHAEKFSVTDRCSACGACAALCPLENIRLEAGRPHWGKSCTHCMACICRCPAQAIEYGHHSRSLPRYTCPK